MDGLFLGEWCQNKMPRQLMYELEWGGSQEASQEWQLLNKGNLDGIEMRAQFFF